MTVFTDDQVRQQLRHGPDRGAATRRGRVKTQDGKEYSVRPVADSRSPFGIAGVNLNLCADDIVALVREVRER